MSFQDNLEAAEIKLSAAQKQAGEWERRFLEAVSASKRADDRAAKAEQAADEAVQAAKEAGNRASDALKRAEHTDVLEQRANEQQTRADGLADWLEATNAKLLAAKDDLKAARKELSDVKQTLRQREEEFADAQTLLAAFRQRAQADALILKASN